MRNYKIRLAIALLYSFIILLGCSKDEPATIYEEPTQQDPGDSVSDDQDFIIADNVVVILDDNSEIISSESDLENGSYSIEFLETPPEILVGDIIVGNEEYGFLRKVSSIVIDGNVINMETTQAQLTDVFEKAKIQFSIDPSEFANKSQKRKVNYIAEGVKVSEDGLTIGSPIMNDINIQLGHRTISFAPTFTFDSDIEFFSFNYFLLQEELTFEVTYDYTLIGPASRNETITIYDVDLWYPVWIGPIPLVFVVNIAIVEDFDLSIDRASVTKLKFTNTNTGKVGVQYEDEWDAFFEMNQSSNLNQLDMADEVANITQKLVVGPRLGLSLYGIVGGYIQAGGVEEFNVNLIEPNWDAAMNTGYDASVGLYYDIWIDDGELTKNWADTDNIWYGPTNIEIDSGNDQKIVIYDNELIDPLEEPLKVLVKDSRGVPLKKVNVHFEVKTGGGSVDVPDVPTDASGFAQTNWTLGNESEDQTVEVTISKANGDLIGDSPLEFNATMIDLSGEWVIINTSGNCPEGVNYRFSFNPTSNAINILGVDTEGITSTSFDFDIEDLSLVIGITSEEQFEYICEVDEIFYTTSETGVAVISGDYNNGEFTGTYSVSFTELPTNPCVYNFSCSDTFRIYKD